MRIRITAPLVLTCAAGALLLAAAGSAATTDLTSVPTAQPKAAGVSSANVLSPELREQLSRRTRSREFAEALRSIVA